MMETEYGRSRRGKASRFMANEIAECPSVSIPKCPIAQRNRQLMSVPRRTHGGGLPCFIRGEHLATHVRQCLLLPRGCHRLRL